MLAKATILFFAANPQGTPPLALDEEAREIEAKIRAAQHHDNLELVTKWAVRPDDLLQFLNQYKSTVVHFSGHGSRAAEIILLDSNRQPQPVSKQALAALFKVLKGKIRVVVLNACFSQPQAEAIAQEIDCVVGMGRAVSDHAAIAFAASFYRALGFGESVKNAFEQGKVALMLEGIPEEGTPQLVTKPGVNPDEVIVVNP
jgi:CHAT domain-containing protein